MAVAEDHARCGVCDQLIPCEPDGTLLRHPLPRLPHPCAGSDAHPLVTLCWMAEILPDHLIVPDDDGG